MTASPGTQGFTHPVTPAQLDQNGTHAFEAVAPAEACAIIAERLGAISISKMRFSFKLTPLPGQGWRLAGQVGATVTQSCVVTLEPVRTRIDVGVRRIYLQDGSAQAAEIEIDAEEMDDYDDLPEVLDLAEVAIEEIALALPSYPRAKGARLDGAITGADRDDREKPFAALAALRGKITDEQD